MQTRLYIDGMFVDGLAGGTIEVINPADGTVLAEIAEARAEDQAITIANGTDYGLGGGLWTSDLSRAHRAAAALRAGMVRVNSYKRVNPGSPFGGVGMSGYGREMGFEAMHEYTQPKSVWVNVGGEVPDWYGS